MNKKEDTYFFENNWTLDPLPHVLTELTIRAETFSPPTEIIIAGFSASLYFEIPKSSLETMIITLPECFHPKMYSWPVSGIDVALVETTCYERELLDLCAQYNAKTITLNDRQLQLRTYNVEKTLRAAA